MWSTSSLLLGLAALPLAFAEAPLIATRIGTLTPRAPPADVAIRQIPELSELQRRADVAETFNISFQAINKPLFSANWTNATTGQIPVPGVPVPIELQGTGSFNFVLDCADCRAYGSIVADINDDDGINTTLTFNNVGVFLDFGVLSSTEGTFTISLGKNFAVGDEKDDPFSAKLGLSLDLVFQFDGAVEVSGGFQLSIPDGSQLGFNVDLGFDSNGQFESDAGVKTFPGVDFGLLPIALNSTNANVTVALVLKAEASIATAVGIVDANVGAGAHLTLVQVKFGEVSSNDPAKCKIALFADIESNGGAFAKAGISAGDDISFDQNPEVSTVFATAGTTICLTNTRPALPAATTKPQTTPCAAALVTGTTTTTATYSLTSCLVKAIDCPASLTQIVVATHVDTVTTTRCPASGSGGVFETVAPVTGGVTLPPLQAVTTTVSPPKFASVSPPVNATITGQFQTATPFATATSTRNGTGTVVVSAGVSAMRMDSLVTRTLGGLLSVLIGATLFL